MVAVATALSLHAIPAASEPKLARALALDEALDLALLSGPDVNVAEQKVVVQRAILAGAEVFPSNPSLSLSAGGRYGFSDGPGIDGDLGVSQALPLFGRWGAGIDAAAAGVTAAEADVWAERTSVARFVASAFIAARRAKGQLDVADRRIALIQTIVDTAQRRLAAGDGTVLDVNLWEAELGQAEAQRARITTAYWGARVRLALLCGLDPASPPVPAGELDEQTLADWVSGAATRADLAARRKRIDEAERRTTREERKAWPDITLNAGASTEGAWWRNGPAGDVVGGAGVSVPVPVFDRNQGGIGAARANTNALRAELTRAQLAAAAELAVARAQVTAFEEAATTLRVRVKAKQRANLELLQKAYAAGKLGVSDVLLRQRFVLDAEAAYVDAVADVALARIRLAFASGALSERVNVLVADAAAAGGAQ